ncbi:MULTISPECIES: hypothetical protein [Chelatococcus]|uniref:Uncharacterized protein n=1 Tax=Chelatococcus caeni TaxID=1348468 RepID=A0A840BVU8_9HYPH|nr:MULTISPECIES: hypothetical protein [Chelatococcus]ALA16112.1 hypothetical protein AL346_00260 [Chelatococcus sp. CO-6]MBB4017621.1 hypothetical protein [Chelatococcus caeni]
MKVIPRKKTFESITAGLSKMVDDLLAFADREKTEGQRKLVESGRLMAEHEAHNREADRAKATADKIKGLLA